MDLAHLVSNYEPTKPKCSLPSISHLLQAADSISPISKRPRHEDWDEKPFKRMTLPPTPPLRPGSSFDHHHHHSASFSSAHSSISLPSLISDSSDRRRSSNNSTFSHSTRSSISIPPQQPHQQSASRLSLSPSDNGYPSPAISTAATTPITTSNTNSNSTNTINSPSASSAPSTPTSASTGSTSPSDHHHAMASMTNSTWQHHHYFPPSNTASYPLNHDRYICRICHKAFSRPSSLRIHSHSHTGEKPFRCPHLGCGKAFSVRSNMKRHERGCHSARASHHPSLIS